MENEAHLSCADFGEVYTGRHDWTDYTVQYELKPVLGKHHFVNFRVQGAIRSYAAGFCPGGKFGLYKNENGYRKLAEKKFSWEKGKTYTVSVTVKGSKITASVDDKKILEYNDINKPYLYGCTGLSVREGSHCVCSGIKVKGL